MTACRRSLAIAAIALLCPAAGAGQTLTGELTCTVRDAHGAVLNGAEVRLASPALMSGAIARPSTGVGEARFPGLPPGTYHLEITLAGFSPAAAGPIEIGAGQKIERKAVLQVAGVAASIVVAGFASRMDTHEPGFSIRFGPDDVRSMPSRRASMFDLLRAAPGISPTSPSNGTNHTVSSLGSGTNENLFLIDGTNFTCPCNGVARAEPVTDFIHEVQVQSAGASVEYGNMQGAVVNIVTRQGSERFLFDVASYWQFASLTSQPVRRPVPKSTFESGYTRDRYRDVATSLGGPARANRLWFFAGYQHLRDYDSQPGSDPAFPRQYEQDKVFAKLTWRLRPGWQLVQSAHREVWTNPEPATPVRRIEATIRRRGHVPAVTFGHLTHTTSANSVWDIRLGRFHYVQREDPSTGDRLRPGHSDSVTGVLSDAPPSIGDLTLIRTTAKASFTRYSPEVLGADHEWKVGIQVEKGEHHAAVTTPGGRRFIDAAGRPSEVVSTPAFNIGGMFVTSSVFARDAIAVGDRMTMNAGVRFDHSRAISQDLHALDAGGREMDVIVRGAGTLYTWNAWSPRAGMTAKLTADGRLLLRGAYGRYTQGVLTGEIQGFHPGAKPTTFTAFSAETGDYTGPSRVVDPRALQLDARVRPPRTDEFAIGFDRAIARTLSLALAYIRKDGRDYVGWMDAGGNYVEGSRPLADGRIIKVFSLTNGVQSRRFLLTNPPAYSLTYNGLVAAVEKRRSRGWQAFGSYTLSRAYGLQPSSGTDAAGPQSSTIAPPTNGATFGRDPNDLTNARGRLPNDRPHILRLMGSIDAFRTGIVVAGNLQHFSGKPWAASAIVNLGLQNPNQRVLLEPRGTRRLPSQTLLDLRVSRVFPLRRGGRLELLLDVLNVLNDTSAEGLITDVLTTVTVARNPDFGAPNVFVDPRRALISVRWRLGS